jgi:phosphoribosylaminoimidazolecarboxamide formyltransferase/IMP cyclohydrolase
MARIQRALLSVSDKTGLVAFAQALAQAGVELVSTGGTAKALREGGLKVLELGDYTGFPEMLDGRVKTLHPKVHGGLLFIRGNAAHEAAVRQHGIGPIDLVVVNLYPFEQTVARPSVSLHDAIENIDIGGPSMLRSAAKNHDSVTVVTDPADYTEVASQVLAGGETTLELRRRLAAKVYARTAAYDTAIAAHLARAFGVANPNPAGELPARLVMDAPLAQALRYGENPHQKAALYVEVGGRTHVLSRVAKLHGRALSFNNVLDLDAARHLLEEFEPATCVIVKHNNPCGVATAEGLGVAYEKALACDPMSAFGGVIALNRNVDGPLAERLHEHFIEVLIAPSYDDDALNVLRQKEAIRILEATEQRRDESGDQDLKRVRGGLLVQEPDRIDSEREKMQLATESSPSGTQWDDLWFAWKVCKHVRSNAIVIAKDNATIGVGAGQMSRVDSVRIAIEKARDARGDDADEVLAGSVVASDAFFPFPDGPQLAMEAGVTAFVQPGGSVRDAEVIAACDERGAAMVFTGRRHFRH